MSDHSDSSLGDSSFSERLAYARWVRVVDESDKALAARAKVTAVWLGKWKVRADAPQGRKEGPRLARALGVSEEWLLDGEGDPPDVELWNDWLLKRRGITRTDYQSYPDPEAQPPAIDAESHPHRGRTAEGQ